MNDEKYFTIGDLKIPDSKIITMDEWVKENIVSDFIRIPADDPIAKQYPLITLSYNDMCFTDEIEDDRINTTVKLSDYDWMGYEYDTRFPTLKVGTLAIRFEYFGAQKSCMYVKQFLPAYMTDEKTNYVVYHTYEFSTDIFDKYMAKDMKSRYDNIINDSSYAYNCRKIMIDWFNEVLMSGEYIANHGYFPEGKFCWESVRIIKNRVYK